MDLQDPFGGYNPQIYSITRAEIELNKEHCGLTDVKSHILKFLPVRKLGITVQGKTIPLCLLASVRWASGGGLTDIAESMSHRWTYVGCLNFPFSLSFFPSLKWTRVYFSAPLGEVIQEPAQVVRRRIHLY